MENTHQDTPQVDASRRRLTKAGLAAPAVLGILASTPVLGVGGVPYKCTISGQVSGNISGHAMETCTSLGQSKRQWKTYFSATSGTPNKLTLISEWFPNDPILTTNYFYITGGVLTTNSSKPVASIYKILSLTAPEELVYAQKALVLLLNAKGHSDTSTYPLTADQAKKLYVAAATPNGAFNDTNPPVTWNNAEVKDFIALLYH